MTEGDAGWKASVDGVVSDFDVVTRHLRRRQGQAVRVAWSVVAATALAMGGLIVVNLTSAGVAPSAVPVSPAPPLAVIDPGSQNLTAPGFAFPSDTPGFPSPAPAAIPATPVTGSGPGATRPKRRLTQVTAPVLAAVPVPPPAAVAPVTTAPPTDSPQPSPPPSSPSPSGGIVDALLGGVVHGTG